LNDRAIKIADFGFAKKAPTDACLKTQCGTPGYVAPEILEGVAYGTKCDIWSLGVITYILLGGYPPFSHSEPRKLYALIRKAEYEFHDQYWKDESQEAKDFITSCLTLNPVRRLSASEALRHPWIVGGGSMFVSYSLDTNLTMLKKFNAKRKLKAAVYMVSLVVGLSQMYGIICLMIMILIGRS